jgi:hypothetical protein
VFSFIKAIQKLLAELKKRKGLWFSILSASSISGIFIALYLITSVTDTASAHVYEDISHTYKKNLDVRLLDRQKDYKNMVLALKSNDNFVANLNNIPVVDGIIKKYNDNLLNNGFEGITIKFYSTLNQVNVFKNSINAVINRKSSLYGLEVLLDGPSVVYLEPVFVDQNLVGVLEVKQKLLNFKADYEKAQGGLFLFLLQERSMTALSTDIKNGDYKVIVEDLFVEEKRYDGLFYANMIEEGSEGLKFMKEHGYRVNESYFKTYKEIFDINGAFIGYIIVGEKVEGSSGFVNIVNKLTKEVTLIALGLVMSILLFMF